LPNSDFLASPHAAFVFVFVQLILISRAQSLSTHTHRTPRQETWLREEPAGDAETELGPEPLVEGTADNAGGSGRNGDDPVTESRSEARDRSGRRRDRVVRPGYCVCAVCVGRERLCERD